MNASFIDTLKAHKLSLTAVRLSLLQALHQHPHTDAAHLFKLVKKKISTASLQGVYKNLVLLSERGIIRCIKPKGHVALYETRINDNHHHLVCTQCSCIMDTHCHAAAPCLAPDHHHGFLIAEAEITFWGLCPSCQPSQHKRRQK